MDPVTDKENAGQQLCWSIEDHSYGDGPVCMLGCSVSQSGSYEPTYMFQKYMQNRQTGNQQAGGGGADPNSKAPKQLFRKQPVVLSGSESASEGEKSNVVCSRKQSSPRMEIPISSKVGGKFKTFFPNSVYNGGCDKYKFEDNPINAEVSSAFQGMSYGSTSVFQAHMQNQQAGGGGGATPNSRAPKQLIRKQPVVLSESESESESESISSYEESSRARPRKQSSPAIDIPKRNTLEGEFKTWFSESVNDGGGANVNCDDTDFFGDMELCSGDGDVKVKVLRVNIPRENQLQNATFREQYRGRELATERVEVLQLPQNLSEGDLLGITPKSAVGSLASTVGSVKTVATDPRDDLKYVSSCFRTKRAYDANGAHGIGRIPFHARRDDRNVAVMLQYIDEENIVGLTLHFQKYSSNEVVMNAFTSNAIIVKALKGQGLLEEIVIKKEDGSQQKTWVSSRPRSPSLLRWLNEN